MTLQDFFQYVSAQPLALLVYFVGLPLLAWVVGEVATGSTNIKFWGYVYSLLAYLVCIPGIFAVSLNVYTFLFERQSIWAMNLLTQVLPIVSMCITLVLIKRKIPFEYVPYFGKLSGFITIIAACMGIMWFIDRTRIMVFSYMPFQYIIGFFVLMLVAIRYGWSKLF